MKSPLTIGTALDRLPADRVAILANKYLLALARMGRMGSRRRRISGGLIRIGRLMDRIRRSTGVGRVRRGRWF